MIDSHKSPIDFHVIVATSVPTADGIPRSGSEMFEPISVCLLIVMSTMKIVYK